MSITNKERISLTIDKNLLKQIDNSKKDFSRSSFVEKILKERFSDKKVAVILAGGPSQALYTKDKQLKPLYPIRKNKTLIEFQIEKLKDAGFNKILFISKKEIIAEIFKKIGEKDLMYIEEKDSLGTAQTLSLARDEIESDFLFLPCDHYFEFDIKKLENVHKNSNATTTLAVYYGKKHEWHKSSLIEIEGNKIINYDETAKSDSNLTSVFIGFSKPRIFEYIPSSKVEYSLQKDVFPVLAKEGELNAFLFNSNWLNLE
jgi:NDP-sugar pyrophosphorylase family protein